MRTLKNRLKSNEILRISILIIQKANMKLSFNNQMTQCLANSIGMFARMLVALGRCQQPGPGVLECKNLVLSQSQTKPLKCLKLVGF